MRAATDVFDLGAARRLCRRPWRGARCPCGDCSPQNLPRALLVYWFKPSTGAWHQTTNQIESRCRRVPFNAAQMIDGDPGPDAKKCQLCVGTDATRVRPVTDYASPLAQWHRRLEAFLRAQGRQP